MATERTIAKRVQERDEKVHELHEFVARGIQLSDPRAQAVDERIAELNAEIVAYGETIEPGAPQRSGQPLDSAREESG